jgi:hypothetical protein
MSLEQTFQHQLEHVKIILKIATFFKNPYYFSFFSELDSNPGAYNGRESTVNRTLGGSTYPG